MTLISELIDYDFFTWINIITVFASLVLIGVTIAHYRFFRKSVKSLLAKRIRNVFFADFLSALSVLSFNATVFFAGSYAAYYNHESLRIAFKLFQAATVFYTIIASWRLHQAYKKVS